jgi:hypothetical protein
LELAVGRRPDVPRAALGEDRPQTRNGVLFERLKCARGRLRAPRGDLLGVVRRYSA